MSKNKDKDSKLLFFLVLFFVVAGLYLLFNPKQKSQNQSFSSVEPQTQPGKVNWQRLNEKMRMLEGQKKIQQMQQEAKNAMLSRELEFSDVRDRAKPAREYNLDMLPEDLDSDVYADLDHKQYIKDAQRPRDVINAQKQLDQVLNNLDQQRQKEFVKQFVENAREGGWDVKVSDELKVIEVHRIRKRRSYPTRVPQARPQDSRSSSTGIN